MHTSITTVEPWLLMAYDSGCSYLLTKQASRESMPLKIQLRPEQVEVTPIAGDDVVLF